MHGLVKTVIVLAACCFLLTASEKFEGSESPCFPRLVRLMIGDAYAESTGSPYTAAIAYQTYEECGESGIIL